MEVSAPIVQSLVHEVYAMRVACSIPFSWDTSMYTNPLQTVAPTPLAMSPEERAEYDSILHRKSSGQTPHNHKW